jgi:LAS superfamily LD-carboxypeptidase LdcB
VNYNILVNKENFVDENDFFDRVLIETVNVENNPVFVEEETLKHFQLMSEYQNKSGYKIGILEAYRSFNQQEKLIERLTAKYGRAYTEKYAANPGTSEHQTGLALDISIAVNGKFLTENNELIANEDKFLEVHNILHSYGFILRYPKGKESITGYPYEPWHIRYVGEELASKLLEQNLTLEEGIELLN